MVRQMTDEHREAMAKARVENKCVAEYLEALETHRPKRGRQRTIESMQKRMQEIVETIDTASPVKRVQLVQERMDLAQEIAASQEVIDITDLEDQFVTVAATYSGRKGITYSAWREVGVPAGVLQRAGISRNT